MKRLCVAMLIIWSAIGPSWADPEPLGAFDMRAVADALEDCAPWRQAYFNPLVGENGEAVIEGVVDGLCVYAHRMTATFTQTCRFDEPTRRAAAADMRRIAAADSVSHKSRLGAGGVEATYEIDGVAYPDTMTIAANDGTCVSASTRPEFAPGPHRTLD